MDKFMATFYISFLRLISTIFFEPYKPKDIRELDIIILTFLAISVKTKSSHYINGQTSQKHAMHWHYTMHKHTILHITCSRYSDAVQAIDKVLHLVELTIQFTGPIRQIYVLLCSQKLQLTHF